MMKVMDVPEGRADDPPLSDISKESELDPVVNEHPSEKVERPYN